MPGVLKEISEGRSRAVIIAGWSTLFCGLLAVALALYQLREDALTQARRSIGNLSAVLSGQTARSVQAIDIVLRDLQHTVAEHYRGDVSGSLGPIGEAAFRSFLREKQSLIPQAEFVSVLDAAGKVINTSRGERRIGLDLSDREYFVDLRKNNDPSLYIGSPVQDRGTGEWTIFLARRVNEPGGAFLGVVTAGIRLSYFEGIYRSIDLPFGESFLLLKRDGAVLVRHPDPVRRAGQLMPKSSPWYSLVQAGGGFYTSPGYFDGVPRIVAVRPLTSYPLVMNASVSEDAVLALWRRQATVGGLAALLIFGYAAYLMQLTQKQFRRLRRSRGAVQTILNTMDQGLLMVDQRGRLVHCNERARDLLAIPPHLADRMPLFTEVLTYQWEANRSGREDGTFEEFLRKRIDGREPSIQELRRPNGTILEVRNVPMVGGGFVRTYTDITIRKAAEERVRYLAHHDHLTALTNRAAFRERLDDALRMARSSGRGTAVLYLDLDRFKHINDSFGHEAGDVVLAEVAERMRSCVRMIDTVARVGGDEFAIILPFLDSPVTAADLANRLIAVVGKPYTLGDSVGDIGVSIGIAIFPEHATTADTLLASADAALYAAKRQGRGTYRFAETKITARTSSR